MKKLQVSFVFPCFELSKCYVAPFIKWTRDGSRTFFKIKVIMASNYTIAIVMKLTLSEVG